MLNTVQGPHWKLYHLNNHMLCLLCQATLPVHDISFSHFLTHLSWCYFSYWITWFSSIWMVNYIIGFCVYMTTSICTSFILSQPNKQWNARHQHHRHHHLLSSLLSLHHLSVVLCTLFTLLGAPKEIRFVLFGQGCKTLSRRHFWIWSQQQLFFSSILESATWKRW